LRGRNPDEINHRELSAILRFSGRIGSSLNENPEGERT